MIPIQATCLLSKESLGPLVFGLVKQYLKGFLPTEDQPLKVLLYNPFTKVDVLINVSCVFTTDKFIHQTLLFIPHLLEQCIWMIANG